MDSLSLYDFVLPEELIATTPCQKRGDSKLLCLLRGEEEPRHDQFKNIGLYLQPGDVLVVNNTKVMKARLKAYKATGGQAEILLIRPAANNAWEALIRGCGKAPIGTSLSLGSLDGPSISILDKLKHEDQGFLISCDVDMGHYAEHYGEMPLPPYFRRKAEAEDTIRYQTVYAKELGAVASPTAGLHFTEQHLADLQKNGIDVAEITLHVGPGTFLPIRHENISQHTMHREWFSLNDVCAQKLNHARSEGRRIIAVGSTAMRTLEQVMQWAEHKGTHAFFPCQAETAIFIRPGHKFLGCDALITNFHVPRSTLIVLVSAVAGRKRVLRAYQEAIAKQYRFFSYGDACFMEVCP